MRVSVDVGGTFTDVIVLDEESGDLRLEKVETVPADPASGVLGGFAKADAELGAVDFFVHGTTLGINALLTRGGARVAIVTTAGFRDVYELGRTDRDPMYDFMYRKPETLVPRERVLEVSERVTFEGEVLLALDDEEVRAAARELGALDVDAVAVSLLHSYANPAHELRLAEVLAEEARGVSVTLSHQVMREYREYERTSTTVIDAYVKPITRSYLETLEGHLGEGGFDGRFLLTRSGGGAMTVESAKEQPVHLVLSGPAGGVIGAAAMSELLGEQNLVTIDMGGTSLDASLVIAGEPHVEKEQIFETLPVSVPTIDIHTIGAGGGSIAWIDDGGHLQVGPRSAGAVPGPACYGKGGADATFTDAALAVGYLDPANFLGGQMSVDMELTHGAIGRLADQLGLPPDDVASGILRISEAKIVGAVRVISIERGYHPNDFAMLAFGGGGAFVAASVARELGIPRVIVPPGPANFSAFGMLMTDVVHDYSRTHVAPLEGIDTAAVDALFLELVEQGSSALARDGFDAAERQFFPTAEMRYLGQEHAVTVPLPGSSLASSDLGRIVQSFNEAHHRQYGHSMDDPVEIVTLRLRAVGLLPRPDVPRLQLAGSAEAALKGARPVYRTDQQSWADYAVYDRDLLPAGASLPGPAIVEERSSTTVLHAADALSVGEYGELVITTSDRGSG
ncbi:MAG: hydantoinase/oxoprolinase family protein [Gaiellaceae bacterium]